jgi:hypothetical protein
MIQFSGMASRAKPTKDKWGGKQRRLS